MSKIVALYNRFKCFQGSRTVKAHLNFVGIVHFIGVGKKTFGFMVVISFSPSQGQTSNFYLIFSPQGNVADSID